MRLGAAGIALCLSVFVVSGRPAAATSAPPSTPASVSIASLNMAGQPRIEDALASWVRRRGSDVVLLQEVGGHGVDGATFVASLGHQLGYHFVYAPADRFGDEVTQGLAIMSRGPIDDVRILPLDHHHLRFRSRCRIAQVATVLTDAGRVRVVNVHLDTRINSKDRVAQLAPVIDMLDAIDGPQVLGGDFNTMDVGWVQTMWPFPYFQHQVAAVRTRLAESAFHTPFTGDRATFKFLGLPIRLDWLYLKGLAAVDWGVDEVPFSDHRGVWAHVKENFQPPPSVSLTGGSTPMFRAAALSLLVLFQTAQTAPPAADAVKKALDQIQGTWQLVTMNGQDLPAGVDVHLTFTGDKYEQSSNGTVEERGAFKVNPATKPGSIDLMIAEGSDAGKLQLGLYEINGDTLSLSFSAPGDPVRPKTPADGAVIAMLKKGKT